jgi:altronate dehydratase
MKRHPDVRLDAVIEYGQPMQQPGYYFMDSPGNDLESIAGQVASGCNIIFFVTGNGSITNFPFVPTIKIVTTTQRYKLLAKDMDVNAGAYLDGTPMETLGREMFELTLKVASGTRSVGEQAGHAQTQIWRDWRQTDASQLERLLNSPPPNGTGVAIKAGPPAGTDISFPAIRTNSGYTTDQLGLILPTSLCAGQIARMTAERLNRKGLAENGKLSRFVALVHTEGCGVSSGASEALYTRTLLGYLSHPLVKYCLLLEHGCEKTHNDFMRQHVEQMGLDPQRLGWASIQLDGGIDRVMEKIESWFDGQLAAAPAPQYHQASLEALRLGLLSAGPVLTPAAMALAELTRRVVGAGGVVVVPENSALLDTASPYRTELLEGRVAPPSLSYGQHLPASGFHIMETPSRHWVETLTGLGATGVELILAYAGQHPVQGHPLVPLIQLTAEAPVQARYGADIDLNLTGDPVAWPEQILQRVAEVIRHDYIPNSHRQGNLDFQITRGLLGVSL